MRHRKSLVGCRVGPWLVVERFKAAGNSHRWRYVLVNEETGEVIPSKKGHRVLALAHQLGVEVEQPRQEEVSSLGTRPEGRAA